MKKILLLTILLAFSCNKPVPKPEKRKTEKTKEYVCQILKTHKTPIVRVDISRHCFEIGTNSEHAAMLYRFGDGRDAYEEFFDFLAKTYGYRINLEKIFDQRAKTGENTIYLLEVYRIERF